MSQESQNSLTTIALLVGVLAGLTTIVAFLGWRPRWEQTEPSAEPVVAPPPNRPFKREPPKTAVIPQPSQQPAASVEPPKESPPVAVVPSAHPRPAPETKAPIPSAEKAPAVPSAPARKPRKSP